MSAGNGRIQLLGHKSPKPSKAEVEQQMADDIAAIAKAAVIPVVEHYMMQLPALVAQMLADAFAAQGMTLKPPPKPDVTDTVAEPQ